MEDGSCGASVNRKRVVSFGDEIRYQPGSVDRRGCGGEGVNKRRRGEVREERRRDACFFCRLFPSTGFRETAERGGLDVQRRAKFPFYGDNAFWDRVMFVSQIQRVRNRQDA